MWNGWKTSKDYSLWLISHTDQSGFLVDVMGRRGLLCWFQRINSRFSLQGHYTNRAIIFHSNTHNKWINKTTVHVEKVLIDTFQWRKHETFLYLVDHSWKWHPAAVSKHWTIEGAVISNETPQDMTQIIVRQMFIFHDNALWGRMNLEGHVLMTIQHQLLWLFTMATHYGQTYKEFYCTQENGQYSAIFGENLQTQLNWWVDEFI